MLLRSHLNLISVIACSKTVHNITQTKFKLLVYVQSSCTKIIRHCNKYIKNPKAVLFFGRTPDYGLESGLRESGDSNSAPLVVIHTSVSLTPISDNRSTVLDVGPHSCMSAMYRRFASLSSQRLRTASTDHWTISQQQAKESS